MKIRFWTSTQYSGFMEGLIRELNAQGMDALQCYHISERSYRAAKQPLARLWLRFRQYILYPLHICGALAGKGIKNYALRIENKFIQSGGSSSDAPTDANSNPASSHEVAVVSTNTFYAPYLATFFHPNVVHLVYDLFPEAMIHSGKWREGSIKVKAIRWITHQTLQRARCNVFLGQRLQDYVESIHGTVPNSTIIEVGADQALFPHSPEERRNTQTENPKLESPPIVLYCGNFGHMHDSQTLFDYWRNHAPAGTATSPTFKFHCSGPKRTALEQIHAELPAAQQAHIQLGDGLDQSEWIAAMERADVALVTMRPGSQTVVMPSKTYSAMMAGQAILAIAPEDSDLVDLIQTADCGWWIQPGDSHGLGKILEQIISQPEQLLQKRRNAYNYAQAHLGQNGLAKKWARLRFNGG